MDGTSQLSNFRNRWSRPTLGGSTRSAVSAPVGRRVRFLQAARASTPPWGFGRALNRFVGRLASDERKAGESPDAFKHQGTHNIPQCGLFSSFFSDVFFSIGIKR